MSPATSFEPYTDVYFLRSLAILKECALNPFVRAQIFFRGKSGKIAGIKEAIDIIRNNSNIINNGGRVYYLPDNTEYYPEETVLLIEARIQDVITLETVLLGILSSETTKLNEGIKLDLSGITKRMEQITNLVGERPVFYFGARHWRYDEDEKISKAVFEGGAAGASTPIGAQTVGRKGVGTIPHSLENIFSWKYGISRAVVEATKAFDRVIDKEVPRVALVDYANKEVEDSIQAAKALNGKLTGVRVDTCGENIMQGAINVGDRKYWYGKGVSISGVYNLRSELNKSGFKELKIFLSSGFGEIEKVKAFVDAEDELQVQLFDSLGVGNIFNSKVATMDIVSVGDDIDNMLQIAKVGRKYKPNKKLLLLD